MNLAKLPKEKRNQLILVVLVTVSVLVALGYGLIRYQYENLKRLADKKVEAESKRQRMEGEIAKKDVTKAVLDEKSKILAENEVGMAYGDTYSWAINTINRFKANYKVEIPQFSPAAQSACTLLPRFPYKQATFSIAGSAYYHDLGRFIADFENEYPYMRIVNVTLELNSNPASGEREKLSFKMDLIALVRQNKS